MVPPVTEEAHLNSLVSLGAGGWSLKGWFMFKWSALLLEGEPYVMVVAYREKVLWKLARIQKFFVAHGYTLALGTMCSVWMVSPIFSVQMEPATFLFPFKKFHASWRSGAGGENVVPSFWVYILIGGSSPGSVHLSEEVHLGRNWPQFISLLMFQHTSKKGGNCRPLKQ